jgi:peptide/nickel transport system substrate-binding protein
MARFKKWWQAVVGLLGASALVLSASGCTVSTKAAAYDGPPKDGGHLTVLINNFAAGWIANGSSISSYELNVWGQITDRLVHVDPEGEVTPWIAQSWEISDDGKTYTLHLKDGVTFSDGEKLDAEAVVKNIDTWAKGNEAEGIQRVGLFPASIYDKSTAVDESTVKISLKKPSLGFLKTLGYHGSILISPKTLALPASQQADLSNEIGSGPYTVKSWKQNDSVVLERRPDYDWGPESSSHTGAARIEKITFKVVPEDSLRSSSVQTGQADVAFNVSPLELSKLKEKGFTVQLPKYLGFSHGFKLNTTVEPFTDKRVRQAVQAGIDRQEIIDTVYTEDWEAAKTLVNSNVPGSTDASDLLEYRPERAEELLDEAGWKPGADGVRVKNGKRLSITLFASPYLSTSGPLNEVVAKNLKDIGFHVDQQVLDASGYSAKVDQNPKTALSEVTRSFVDAGTVSEVLTSNNNGEDWFRLGDSDETLNELSARVASTTDEKVRDENLAELQRYVLSQGYFVPLEQIIQRIYLQSPRLRDVTFDGLAVPNYYDAWLSDGK